MSVSASVSRNFRLHRPRQWGVWWLACELYSKLGLDEFWLQCLPECREGTPTRTRTTSSATSQKWSDLFGADFDFLLYSLTSTYFNQYRRGLRVIGSRYCGLHRINLGGRQNSFDLPSDPGRG
jgi:hypothetical protein